MDIQPLEHDKPIEHDFHPDLGTSAEMINEADPELAESNADPAAEEPQPAAERTAVNVLILAPLGFEGSQAAMANFLAPCSAKQTEISKIFPIQLDAIDQNSLQTTEDLRSHSDHAKYTSVKENHMDQSQSTREIQIGDGNRIVSDSRRWYLTQVFYAYQAEAVSCVMHFNSNMKPIYYFDETSQANLFVLVGLAKTMDVRSYISESSIVTCEAKPDQSAGLFSPFVIHPPFPVIVDTINGAVPFSSQELLFTNGLKDYVNLKLNSGRCTRRTVCKHFDPFQKIQCRYGTNCHFIHINENSMDRLLQPATLYPPLRLPKLEDDLQISTCENNRRHDTLVLRYLPKDTTGEDVEYMFQECDGFVASYFQLNEFYSSAIVRFDSVQSATKALVQASENELNISFYGVVEDLKALFITDARECNYSAAAINRLPGDKIKEKEEEERARNPPVISAENDGAGHHDRGKFRSDRDFQYRQRRPHDFAGNDGRRGDNVYSGDYKRRKPAGNDFDRPRENYDESCPQRDSQRTQTAQLSFPELPQNWSHQLNTKGTQYYFYELGHEDQTTWYHPATNEMYYP